MYEDTRIHLDSVNELGEFIEFEVPVSGSAAKAEATIKFLCEAFKIAESSYFKGSYVDLMPGLKQI
jgi:adenylate cyclase class IV